jgi:hypothetical protein
LTIARLRRLQRLESRQPRGPVWRDPFDACMRVWVDLQAVAAGRASWRKLSERELSEDDKAAYDRLVAEYDSMARRLATEVPQDV